MKSYKLLKPCQLDKENLDASCWLDPQSLRSCKTLGGFSERPVRSNQ
jgi:hypothetical protein